LGSVWQEEAAAGHPPSLVPKAGGAVAFKGACYTLHICPKALHTALDGSIRHPLVTGLLN
jgi:hypothetical protein